MEEKVKKDKYELPVDVPLGAVRITILNDDYIKLCGLLTKNDKYLLEKLVALDNRITDLEEKLAKAKVRKVVHKTGSSTIIESNTEAVATGKERSDLSRR